MGHPLARLGAVVVIAAAITMATMTAGLAPAGAQERAPTSGALVLSDDHVPVGDWVTVRGEGFPAGVLMLVEVCGTNAKPELGCDDQSAINAEVDRNGSFEVPLHVVEPPSPCPCTIRAVNRTEDVASSTSIAIDGVDAPAQPSPSGATGGAALVPEVSVSGVALVGDETWTTWFGASPQRTFRYTVHNTGTGVAEGLKVELRGGDGEHLDVLKAPAVGPLDPGASRSFEVPVDLGPFAIGTYRVVAKVSGVASGDDPKAFGAETSSFPWMIIVIPALVLFEVLLLVSRNRLRDRVQQRSTVAAVAPVVASSVMARVERTRAVGVDTAAVAGRVVVRVGLPPGEGADPGAGPGAEPDDGAESVLPTRTPKRTDAMEEPVGS